MEIVATKATVSVLRFRRCVERRCKQVAKRLHSGIIQTRNSRLSETRTWHCNCRSANCVVQKRPTQHAPLRLNTIHDENVWIRRQPRLCVCAQTTDSKHKISKILKRARTTSAKLSIQITTTTTNDEHPNNTIKIKILEARELSFARRRLRCRPDRR